MFKRYTRCLLLLSFCCRPVLTIGQDSAAGAPLSQPDSLTIQPARLPDDTLIAFINSVSLAINEQALTAKGNTQVVYTPYFQSFAATHQLTPLQAQAMVDNWVRDEAVKTNTDALLQGARAYYLRQLETAAQQYEQAALRQESMLPTGITGADFRDADLSRDILNTCTAWLLAGNCANEHNDHGRAIRLYRKADSLLAFGNATQLSPATLKQKNLVSELLAAALYEEGKRIGDAAGYVLLAQGAIIEQNLLKQYVQPLYPKEWARTQSNLGTILQAQGELVEESDSLYRLSLAAFKAAQAVYTRAELPQDWARMQNNIGVVLSQQGNIEEAVAAYRLALDVYTSKDHADDWALTQYNLGNMLQFQAVELKSGNSLELLRHAIGAYRLALTVFTAQHQPDDYGWVQHKLGLALFQQARATAGRNPLTEAVAAFRAALTVRTKEGSPGAWANTQYNLGTTLWEENSRAIGGNLELLDEAIRAFEAAATVYTQKEYPDQYFNTQNNLGLLYEQKQQWANAIRHFEKIREIEPMYAAQKLNELRKKVGQ